MFFLLLLAVLLCDQLWEAFHVLTVGHDRIVGKGIHSQDHIQKIKPRVEQICRELGLQFATEENTGRMYINLQGGPAVMPSMAGGFHGQGVPSGQQPFQQQQQQYQNGGYHPQGQHSNSGHGQQNNPNAELEAEIKKDLPRIIRALRSCCVVM